MKHQALTDSEFVQQFEAQNLAPDHFDHVGHLRLAYLYLEAYDFEVALLKLATGIKAYANSLGASDKFHVTVTDAITRVIALRMGKSQFSDWHAFLNCNNDLVDDALSILCQYYSKERLFSKAAKESLISPDIKAIKCTVSAS